MVRIFYPLPRSLQTMSGSFGGLLALASVWLQPQLGANTWLALPLALLIVPAYLGSLHIRSSRFQWLAALLWASVLLLVAGHTGGGVTAAIGGRAASPESSQLLLLLLHLLLWVLATAVVWLATMQAAVLVRHHYCIKKGVQLPPDEQLPLNDMHRLLTFLAGTGLVLVTMAVLFSYWWQSVEEGATAPVKYYLALSSWLLVVALLGSRWLLGWRGYRVAGWIFAALGTLALTLAWGFSFG